MNGSKVFIDTNIIVYLLNGDDTLASFLQGRTVYVSFITELELLGYKKLKANEEKLIEDFLDNCIIIDINPTIKREVIKLKRKFSVKLPDAIIIGSSKYMDIPVLTSDNEFNKIDGLEVIFYDYNGDGF